MLYRETKHCVSVWSDIIIVWYIFLSYFCGKILNSVKENHQGFYILGNIRKAISFVPSNSCPSLGVHMYDVCVADISFRNCKFRSQAILHFWSALLQVFYGAFLYMSPWFCPNRFVSMVWKKQHPLPQNLLAHLFK